MLICALHGATFLSLKTTGDMHERSRDLARRIAPATAAAVIGFAIWTHVAHSDTFFLNPVELLAILAVLAPDIEWKPACNPEPYFAEAYR